MERIVGVTACVTAIKSTTVVPVEWQIQPQALGQIGIGDELAAKRDDVRVARFDDRVRSLFRETACSD